MAAFEDVVTGTGTKHGYMVHGALLAVHGKAELSLQTSIAKKSMFKFI